jgi:hypothetical protein
MLFLVAMVVVLLVATAFNSDDLARAIGVGFVAAYFLYEPLLVSLAGGTVGHYLSNLRVVDDRTDGNISFPKAVARVVVKAVLGWYSFVSMAAARRHQAVHDLLTRSTVQIRDPAKALPHHYSGERVELSSLGMPSPSRRIVVTGAYLFLVTVLWGAVVTLLVDAIGALTDACLEDMRQWCSVPELILLYVVGLGALCLIALCLGLGWRGRLWGARRAESA